MVARYKSSMVLGSEAERNLPICLNLIASFCLPSKRVLSNHSFTTSVDATLILDSARGSPSGFSTVLDISRHRRTKTATIAKPITSSFTH